jgi:antitoxin VapB
MTNIKKTDRKEQLRQADQGCLKSVLMDELTAIRLRFAALPVLDDRHPDDIMGYDERGLPQ